jgi:hypothetical protein
MRLFRSVIDPGRRWLAKHFNRLRRTLEGLYDRLRDAIAVAVARAAEDAVREGVSALLADTPPLSPPDYPTRHFTPPAGWRDTDDEYEELRRWEENLDQDQEWEGRSEPRTHVPPTDKAPEPTSLPLLCPIRGESSGFREFARPTTAPLGRPAGGNCGRRCWPSRLLTGPSRQVFCRT